MCKLIELNNGNYVADIKHKYIVNIADQAGQCSNISRIVLFGSALETRCTEESDIDIAVFGKESKTKYLRSKEFKEFQRRLFSFGDSFHQNYDILYFCDSKTTNDAIMGEIDKGIEIYRRAKK